MKHMIAIKPKDDFELCVSFKKRSRSPFNKNYYQNSLPPVYSSGVFDKKISYERNVTNINDSLEGLPSIPIHSFKKSSIALKKRKKKSKKKLYESPKRLLNIKYLKLYDNQREFDSEDNYEYSNNSIGEIILFDKQKPQSESTVQKNNEGNQKLLDYLDNIPNNYIREAAHYIVDNNNNSSLKEKKIITEEKDNNKDLVIHNVFFRFIISNVMHKVEVRNQLNQILTVDNVINLINNEIYSFREVLMNPKKFIRKGKNKTFDYFPLPSPNIADNLDQSSDSKQINNILNNYNHNVSTIKKVMKNNSSENVSYFKRNQLCDKEIFLPSLNKHKIKDHTNSNGSKVIEKGSDSTTTTNIYNINNSGEELSGIEKKKENFNNIDKDKDKDNGVIIEKTNEEFSYTNKQNKNNQIGIIDENGNFIEKGGNNSQSYIKDNIHNENYNKKKGQRKGIEAFNEIIGKNGDKMINRDNKFYNKENEEEEEEEDDSNRLKSNTDNVYEGNIEQNINNGVSTNDINQKKRKKNKSKNKNTITNQSKNTNITEDNSNDNNNKGNINKALAHKKKKSKKKKIRIVKNQNNEKSEYHESEGELKESEEESYEHEENNQSDKKIKKEGVRKKKSKKEQGSSEHPKARKHKKIKHYIKNGDINIENINNNIEGSNEIENKDRSESESESEEENEECDYSEEAELTENKQNEEQEEQEEKSNNLKLPKIPKKSLTDNINNIDNKEKRSTKPYLNSEEKEIKKKIEEINAIKQREIEEIKKAEIQKQQDVIIEENKQQIKAYLEEKQKKELIINQDNPEVEPKTEEQKEILQHLLLRNNPNFFNELQYKEMETKKNVEKTKYTPSKEINDKIPKPNIKYSFKYYEKEGKKLIYDNLYLYLNGEKESKPKRKVRYNENSLNSDMGEGSHGEEMIKKGKRKLQMIKIRDYKQMKNINSNLFNQKDNNLFYKRSMYKQKLLKQNQNEIDNLEEERKKQEKRDKLLLEFFEKIKELKNSNSSDEIAKEMEKFLDDQVLNSDYALKKQKEHRLNSFIDDFKNIRERKKIYRDYKEDNLKFKTPIDFSYEN